MFIVYTTEELVTDYDTKLYLQQSPLVIYIIKVSITTNIKECKVFFELSYSFWFHGLMNNQLLNGLMYETILD